MEAFFVITGVASALFVLVIVFNFLFRSVATSLFYFAWVLFFYATYALTVGSGLLLGG